MSLEKSLAPELEAEAEVSVSSLSLIQEGRFRFLPALFPPSFFLASDMILFQKFVSDSHRNLSIFGGFIKIIFSSKYLYAQIPEPI